MICLRVTVVNSRLQLHEVYKDSLSKSRPLQTHNHIYFEAISLNVAGCLYVATMLYRIYTWTFDIKKHVGNFYSHISLSPLHSWKLPNQFYTLAFFYLSSVKTERSTSSAYQLLCRSLYKFYLHTFPNISMLYISIRCPTNR